MVTLDDLVFARSDREFFFFFACFFEYASEIPSLINVTPSMPRIAAHQQHRPNAENSNTPFEYHHVNMSLPFLDHIRRY